MQGDESDENHENHDLMALDGIDEDEDIEIYDAMYDADEDKDGNEVQTRKRNLELAVFCGNEAISDDPEPEGLKIMRQFFETQGGFNDDFTDGGVDYDYTDAQNAKSQAENTLFQRDGTVPKLFVHEVLQIFVKFVMNKPSPSEDNTGKRTTRSVQRKKAMGAPELNTSTEPQQLCAACDTPTDGMLCLGCTNHISNTCCLCDNPKCLSSKEPCLKRYTQCPLCPTKFFYHYSEMVHCHDVGAVCVDHFTSWKNAVIHKLRLQRQQEPAQPRQWHKDIQKMVDAGFMTIVADRSDAGHMTVVVKDAHKYDKFVENEDNNDIDKLKRPATYSEKADSCGCPEPKENHCPNQRHGCKFIFCEDPQCRRKHKEECQYKIEEDEVQHIIRHLNRARHKGNVQEQIRSLKASLEKKLKPSKKEKLYLHLVHNLQQTLTAVEEFCLIEKQLKQAQQKRRKKWLGYGKGKKTPEAGVIALGENHDDFTPVESSSSESGSDGEFSNEFSDSGSEEEVEEGEEEDEEEEDEEEEGNNQQQRVRKQPPTKGKVELRVRDVLSDFYEEKIAQPSIDKFNEWIAEYGMSNIYKTKLEMLLDQLELHWEAFSNEGLQARFSHHPEELQQIRANQAAESEAFDTLLENNQWISECSLFGNPLLGPVTDHEKACPECCKILAKKQQKTVKPSEGMDLVETTNPEDKQAKFEAASELHELLENFEEPFAPQDLPRRKIVEALANLGVDAPNLKKLPTHALGRMLRKSGYKYNNDPRFMTKTDEQALADEDELFAKHTPLTPAEQVQVQNLKKKLQREWTDAEFGLYERYEFQQEKAEKAEKTKAAKAGKEEAKQKAKADKEAAKAEKEPKAKKAKVLPPSAAEQPLSVAQQAAAADAKAAKKAEKTATKNATQNATQNAAQAAAADAKAAKKTEKADKPSTAQRQPATTESKAKKAKKAMIELPPGWRTETTTRQEGKSKGHKDKYFIPPKGHQFSRDRFRSMTEVARELDAKAATEAEVVDLTTEVVDLAAVLAADLAADL